MDDEEARGRGMLTSRRTTTIRVQEGDDEQEGEEEDEVIGVEGQRGGHGFWRARRTATASLLSPDEREREGDRES